MMIAFNPGYLPEFLKTDEIFAKFLNVNYLNI